MALASMLALLAVQNAQARGGGRGGGGGGGGGGGFRGGGGFHTPPPAPHPGFAPGFGRGASPGPRTIAPGRPLGNVARPPTFGNRNPALGQFGGFNRGNPAISS